jgi:hypothetical protein
VEVPDEEEKEENRRERKEVANIVVEKKLGLEPDMSQAPPATAKKIGLEPDMSQAPPVTAKKIGLEPDMSQAPPATTKKKKEKKSKMVTRSLMSQTVLRETDEENTGVDAADEEVVADTNEENIGVDAADEEVVTSTNEENICVDAADEEVVTSTNEENIGVDAADEEVVAGTNEENIGIDAADEEVVVDTAENDETEVDAEERGGIVGTSEGEKKREMKMAAKVDSSGKKRTGMEREQQGTETLETDLERLVERLGDANATAKEGVYSVVGGLLFFSD